MAEREARAQVELVVRDGGLRRRPGELVNELRALFDEKLAGFGEELANACSGHREEILPSVGGAVDVDETGSRAGSS